MTTTLQNLRNEIENLNPKSAWDKGVKFYMIYLLDNYEEYKQYNTNLELNEKTLLNGARDWSQYAYGGSGLVYDCSIAETLCTPSELKRKKGGELQPNSQETWLDVEARALSQASKKLLKYYKSVLK